MSKTVDCWCYACGWVGRDESLRKIKTPDAEADHIMCPKCNSFNFGDEHPFICPICQWRGHSADLKCSDVGPGPLLFQCPVCLVNVDYVESKGD